ncbi:hypothetical protein [Neobacillus niacini]|uniref:hypothetical protein n=1 Tax=Neobacillus niacini TaxID=86668 RepID=UPI002855F8ED|nr:hypothetical protein [Neobacillus niacini]MDR6999222.1 hypothetical protein [Neobacillus niacini]
MSFKKEELLKLKENNQELYQKNVQSALVEKRQEFLDEFEDYFRERGFVIRKSSDSVRASFDTLHFKAFSDETGKLMIMKGKEEIANIYIHFDGDTDPNFYYTGSNFEIKFDSPLAILESVFQI